MTFFALFIFAAVIIGAGAMLAPVWHSPQPRIGLASTFLLAIIIAGAILWTEFFRWDTLIIDYLVFGAVTIVVLGGTMAQATIADSANDLNQNRLSKTDLVFFGVIALICLFPIVLRRDNQLLADESLLQAVQEVSSFRELVTDYPSLTQFGATGFYTVSIYLAQQLRLTLSHVYPAVMSTVSFVIILTIYDLGSEVRDEKLGRFLMLFALLFLLVLYWFNSYAYTMSIGILFSLASLIFAIRFYRLHHYLDLLGLISVLTPLLLLSYII